MENKIEEITRTITGDELFVSNYIHNSPLMTIQNSNKEILRFEPNGDIYLHGKLIENDKEVVDGFREFLKSQGCIK